MNQAPPISPSLGTLSSRLDIFFKNLGISRFVVLTATSKQLLLAQDTCDVVLVGDAPSYFLEPALWKMRGSYRFWVLSNVAREFFSRLSGLPEEHFSVIPRSALFEVTEPKYTIADSLSFVYAGRCLQGKNLALLGRVVSQLQGLPEFKNHRFFFAGSGGFESLIDELKHLKWSHPPEYLGDLGSDWVRYPFPRPVYLNLSTYAMEDFSVGTAEAQQQGWPVVVSDWFGLEDVNGREVIRIDPELCVDCPENVAQIVEEIRCGSAESREAAIQEADPVTLPTETDCLRWVRLLKGMGEYEKAFSHCYFHLKLGGDGEDSPDFDWDGKHQSLKLGKFKHSEDVIFRETRSGARLSAVHLINNDIYEMQGTFAKLFRCLAPAYDAATLMSVLDPQFADDPALVDEVRRLLYDAVEAQLIAPAGDRG